MKFKVRCINRQLKPEIVENCLREGGMYAGIGDHHGDGFHGRFVVIDRDKP